MVTVPKLCFCMVVHGKGELPACSPARRAGVDDASELSKELHITTRPGVSHRALLRAADVDELWVGGKCMYKLEPIVADGGELIIYAPTSTRSRSCTAR